MKTITLMPSLVTLLAMCCAGMAADDAATGNSTVEVVVDTWKDIKRNREVPVRIYVPQGTERCPVIIFSHGLWGSNEHYEYLGRQWASHGYISIHVQHHGSDTDALKERMKQADGDQNERPRQRIGERIRDKIQPNIGDDAIKSGISDRPADISFTIDQALTLDKTAGSKLAGRVDLDKIGVAGHSFGGYTAMAIAGESFPGGKSFADPRVKAIIAMSPPANSKVDASRTANIRIPVLIMTGTLDDSPILGGTPEKRTELYNSITHSERYLCIFDGGDHMVFPGGDRNERLGKLRGMKGDPAKDAIFQTFIKASSTAFWDTYLRGDAAAKTWLQSDGAINTLGKDGKWTFKPAK